MMKESVFQISPIAKELLSFEEAEAVATQAYDKAIAEGAGHPGDWSYRGSFTLHGRNFHIGLNYIKEKLHIIIGLPHELREYVLDESGPTN